MVTAMVPPKQSNTIDFDAAKLQRAASQDSRTLSRSPLDLLELRQQLNLQLQVSLEADRILAVFFREIQQMLPVEYLAYFHAGADLRLEFGEAAKHCADYRLTHASEYLGEISFRRAQRFSEGELAQLESLMACLLYPLRNALLYRAAVQSALRDALTGTGNRIAMDQTLGREVEVARRHLLPLSILMLDLDHFKLINDSHGHGAGDEILREIGTLMRLHVRKSDLPARLGGDEFGIVLYHTNAEQAEMFVEILLEGVRAHRFQYEDKQLSISLSVGIAQCDDSMKTPQALYYAADKAL